MNLVCNAGPVIALAKIDKLDLLHKLGGESVSIPETVFHELLAKPGSETTRILHATRSFLEVKIYSCDPPTQISEATRSLDLGEREVIVLAASFQPVATALIDDAAGRRVARQLGLPVLGFAGILLAAKQLDLIEHVIPHLELARINGYWLSDELIETVRAIAKE